MYLAHQSIRRIEQSGGMLGGRTEARVGQITGLISTFFLLVAVLLVGGIIVIGAIQTATSTRTG